MLDVMPRRIGQGQALARLRDEFRVLVEQFLSHWPAPFDPVYGLDHLWGLDVEDRDDEVVVRADVPGFEPDEIDVRLSGRLLTVHAEKKPRGETAGGRSAAW